MTNRRAFIASLFAAPVAAALGGAAYAKGGLMQVGERGPEITVDIAVTEDWRLVERISMEISGDAIRAYQPSKADIRDVFEGIKDVSIYNRT